MAFNIHAINISGHAGDRSWDRSITWDMVQKVGRHGSEVLSKDGSSIIHSYRADDENPDHVINVVTDGSRRNILTVIRDTGRPIDKGADAKELAGRQAAVASETKKNKGKAEQAAKQALRAHEQHSASRPGKKCPHCIEQGWKK